MKSVYLLLVALVACTFTLTTVSGTVYAASAQNAVTETTSTNAKKQVPREVNINTADKELLTQLPGIGPVTADSILQYRQDNGQFTSIEELTKVKGIGTKTLAKLKPYLQTL